MRAESFASPAQVAIFAILSALDFVNKLFASGGSVLTFCRGEYEWQLGRRREGGGSGAQ